MPDCAKTAGRGVHIVSGQAAGAYYTPAVSIDLNVYDAVLLDLDGTIYHEDHALPGAATLTRQLQATGRNYACLTNSTSSPRRIAMRLSKMDILLDDAHIYTAAAAAVDYVLEEFAAGGTHAETQPQIPRVYNLATEGVQEMLDGKVHWVRDENEACDAVIIGVAVNVYATPERQRTAMLLLRNGATAVAICADRVYPSPRGLEFGVGAMAIMLGYAANVTPVYCGKPERFFFLELCRRLNVPPERCILIGDNLESDIAGAKGVGMQTILTLTGVSQRDDVERQPAQRRPDYIINDLTELQ